MWTVGLGILVAADAVLNVFILFYLIHRPDKARKEGR